MDDRTRELLDRVGGAARYAGKCAGQVVDAAKLNVKIFNLKAENDELLRKIGALVYSAHLGADSDQAAVDGLLARLDENRESVEALKKRAAALKSGGDL